MAFYLEVDVVPLVLAAAIYVVYRIVGNCFGASSVDAGCEDSTSASGEGPVEPEPCAEPDESEEEDNSAAAARTPARRVGLGAIALFAFCFFLAASVAWGPAGAARDAAERLARPLLAATVGATLPIAAPSASPSGIAVGSAAATTATATSASHKVVTMRLTRQRVPVRKNGNILYHKNAYVGSLGAGTPSATFKVVIDTGSGHLILPSSYCRSETCRAHRRYKRSISTTAMDYDFDGNMVAAGTPRDQITVSFGSGEVTGVFIEDMFCLRDLMSPTRVDEGVALSNSTNVAEECTRVRFIAATEMSDDPFAEFKFDGVLGLGLAGLSQGPKFHFLGLMANTVLHGSGIFAMFLAESPADESRITFGGWDQQVLAGRQPLWVPVHKAQMGHWMVRLLAVRVGGVNGSRDLPFCEGGGCRAVFDTGTSVLAVPSASFSDIFTALKHPVPSGGCLADEGPLLHFDIDAGQDGVSGGEGNRVTLTLTPRDFARLDAGPKKGSQSKSSGSWVSAGTGGSEASCKPMLMAMDLPAPLGPKLFILGEPVLKRFYTIFDSEAKRIGFGPARGREHWS